MSTLKLSKEVIRLSGIRDATVKEFYATVDRVKDRAEKDKVLVLDPTLINPMRALGVLDPATTKERGIATVFALGPDPIATTRNNIVFFVRSDLNLLQDLVSNIDALNAVERRNIHIYFVPRQTAACQQVLLKRYELFSRHNVTVGEFDYDFIPLDDDVLSMEMPSAHNDCTAEGDPTSLSYVARALYKLQTAHFGTIPHIRAKGRMATSVAKMLRRLGQEHGTETGAGVSQPTPEIDTVLILDREVDPVTPMLTQLTYEGLIDELYGIRAGVLEPPPEVTDSEGKAVTKMVLSNDDAVYSELRDLNFSAVGQALNQRSLTIKAMYEKRHNMQALSELRDFMKQLPEVQNQHKQVGIHTTLTLAMRKLTERGTDLRERVSMEQCMLTGESDREVLEYIDDCICRLDPLKKVLRLVCLYSHCSSSWKQKTMDTIRESLMQCYGIPQMIVFWNQLEKAGLLRRPDAKCVFPTLRKSLQLFVSECNEANPDSVAYVYSGYAPLTARVVELATRSRNAWKSADSVLSAIPGDTYSEEQGGEVPGSTRIVLVVVVGGLTFAEISAIRFVASQARDEGAQNVKCIVATTKLINGNTFLDSIAPMGMNMH
eukprot:PhM_4_TR15875/c0_g1_i1/m.84816/K20182/VPS33; vacuolar protein sorting-associated protein 33